MEIKLKVSNRTVCDYWFYYTIIEYIYSVQTLYFIIINNLSKTECNYALCICAVLGIHVYYKYVILKGPDNDFGLLSFLTYLIF